MEARVCQLTSQESLTVPGSFLTSESPAAAQLIKVILAIVWIGATTWGAGMLLFSGVFAGGPTILGEKTVERQPLSAILLLSSGICAAAGPMAVWWFRRERLWLVLASVLIVAGAGLALIGLIS